MGVVISMVALLSYSSQMEHSLRLLIKGGLVITTWLFEDENIQRINLL